MQPPELARRVLGVTGARYREVRRPYLGGLPGRVGFNLRFATAPRSAGFPGLCQADTIDLYFSPPDSESSSGGGMRVHAVHTGALYRIVGDTAPLPGTGWNDEYGHTLDELCENAGPVFDDPNADGPQPHFFGVNRGEVSVVEAYFAARALELAVEGAASGALRRVACQEDLTTPEEGNCANPRSTLTNLPLNLVYGVEIEPCAEAARSLCVSAGFLRSGQGPRNRVLRVSIRTNAVRVENPLHGLRVVSVGLENSTFVE